MMIENKFLIILIIILEVIYLNDNYRAAENCLTESCDDHPENGDLSKKYNKEWNEIIENIKLAEKNYAVENETNNKKSSCSIDLNTIDVDLLPFHKFGIEKNDLDGIKQYGVKYQIINHKLYRQKECSFPSRCSGIEHFLLENLKQLPNLEMIVNTRDWPQIHKDWGSKMKRPIFSFSKTSEYLDIQYPTWSFWEGGPAISLYPTGLGRWDKHRKLLKAAAEKHPWHRKRSQAFFRGSRTSHERDPLILLSREAPDLVDAQYTKNQAWKSPADTLNREPAKEIPLEDHCQYKYLFNYRGVAASFRFKHLFLCKSMVFHVGDEWKEFFYDSLKPWIHYVPITGERASNTIELKKLIEFFQQNDELAKRIAMAGYQHISDHLKMEHIHCYWRVLLKRYAKLLKYKIERDLDLIELK